MIRKRSIFKVLAVIALTISFSVPCLAEDVVINNEETVIYSGRVTSNSSLDETVKEDGSSQRDDVNPRMVSSETSVTDVAGAKSNPAPTDPIYLHNDFPQLRKIMDDEYGTTVRGGKKFGMLYTTMDMWNPDYQTGNKGTRTTPTDNPTYYRVVWNPDFIAFTEKAETQKALKEAASKAFGDLASDFWGNPVIALGVYYDVVNGIVSNGRTEFRPNQSVSKQDFSIMLAKASWGAKSVEEAKTTGPTYKKITSTSKDPYFAKSWTKIANSMIDTYKMTDEDFKASNSRAETAFEIAMEFWGSEFADYMYKNPDAIKNNFSDLKLMSDANANKAGESIIEIIKYQNSNPNVGTYKSMYYAILFLNQKGVITGMGDGTFQANKSLSRAEAMQMIYAASKVSGQEFYDKANN